MTNKEMVVRWFEEVWNKGNREAIDEMLPAGAVIHDGPVSIVGPEEFKSYFERFQGAFSEIHVTVEELVGEGDLVCYRFSVTMRHTGDSLGMPATGKQLNTTGMAMIRFDGGQFAECWQNWDMLGLLEQIREGERSKTYMASA